MEDEMIDVAIIGAGMAGLSAAVYARLSGLKVKVFEQHSLPGGLCTAWERKGYIFDYCVDYIMGSRKGQGFYSLWKDLGVIEKTQFKHIDSFGRYQGADNQILNLYTDYRRLRQELLAIAPEDAAAINQFCKAIRKARNFMMVEFTPSMRGLFQVLRSLPALFTMQKWAAISTRGWCAELRNAFLREAIPALIGMM